MSFRKVTIFVSAMVIGTIALINSNFAQDKNMANVHMGHVTDGWKDTPDKKGLLPTAIQEAKTAIQHAGFAIQKLGNLVWMKTHTKHVLHAVDASAIAKGPGLGYGVKKAAAGTAKHIGFAANSKAASKNVKTHAVHVATMANNTIARVDEIVALAKKVEASKTAAEAVPLVEKINSLSGQLLNGFDANGDGKVTWKKGEGGLSEAEKHMGFMRKGEGV